MRDFRSIIDDIKEVVANIDFPVKAIAEFPNALMDMPLSEPLLTIGLNEVSVDSSAISCYAGKDGGSEEYSLPADITVELNIYVPTNFYGLINYDVMSLIMDALCQSSIPVYRMKTEKMYYDSTFLSIVYPIKFYIRERICGNS